MINNQHRTMFIDGQVFQSAAWDRGMGKYSLALLKAMLVSSEYNHEKTYIVFTKNMPLDNSIKKLLGETIPKATLIYADLEVPFDPCQADVAKLQKINEATLSELILKYSSDPANTDYVILSLFIDQVCSVFPESSRKIILFYDLIPLQYYERYSKLCTFKNYLKRYRTLFQADIIWTISQTVADDLSIYLGISPKKTFNIDGASIERVLATAKKPTINLPDRFVLMPSGDDLRKNNIRAVQGFEQYRINSDNSDLFLIITSFFDDVTKKQISAFSPNVIFTGNIPENELCWLYHHTLALLFVSEYEGLGLPILEAVEANKPIVCSNLSVFNEISSSAFYYSNPLDAISIADALEEAFTGKAYEEKRKQYADIIKRYSWKNTANKAIAALASPADVNSYKKLKVAVFSPTPSGYSGIGKWVMQLHAQMQEYFEVDYYLEEGKTHKDFDRVDYLPYVANVFPAKSFTAKTYSNYDSVIYNIGNSEFHLDTIKNALYLPGFSILHDTYLTDVYEGPLLDYGYITEDRLKAERLLQKAVKPSNSSYISSIVNNQRGVIAHSDYAKDAINSSLLNKIPVIQTNLPVAVPKQLTFKPKDRVLTIGFAGIIHEAKGLDVIEALAQIDRFKECKIHIFGLPLISDVALQRMRSYPNVFIDTDVSDFEFQNMLREVDVLINFRKFYRGETSASTLQAMALGAVPIVREIGWYDELPSNSVVKAKDLDAVVKELELLLNSAKLRDEISQEGRQLLAREYTHELYAKSIYDFINEIN